MVVKIKSPQSLNRVLNYNEQKVLKGQAVCIHAGNYILNPEQMKFHHKFERLQDQIALNERAKKSNLLHISLNFDPSETLSKEKLTAIADVYMDKIGFGEQPYLVYRHNDAGHPHIHIVTTNIKTDGKRIDTYNIGRNQSEKARKEIEKAFGLVIAQGKKVQHLTGISPVNVQKVHYGKSETRRSITNVLNAVLNIFKYTSLAELNVVLKQYNVVADRGTEDSRIYKAGGLLYKLLDEKGNKIGVPIKASLIYSKPTLKNLEIKFAENELKRKPYKQKLKISVDWILAKAPANLKAFAAALLKDKVQVILRENKDGLVYGITFIDYRTKSVFNGSDLGKQYSIAGIQQKINGQGNNTGEQVQPSTVTAIKKQDKDVLQANNTDKQVINENTKDDLFQQLTGADKTSNRLPYELLKKKKKKRNPNL